MGKYDGWLIVTDMDATLLDDDKQLSDENKKAIDYFIDNGGKFTVATGRMAPEIKMYFDKLRINAPVISNNGAQLYDFDSQQTIFTKCVEERRKKIIRKFHDEIGICGIEVYTDKDDVYIYNESCESQRYVKRKIEVVHGMPDEAWKKNWVKVLIIDEKEKLDRIEPIYREKYDSDYAVRSGVRYLDIMANGVSKGAGMVKLAELLGIKKDRVIAAGDNMNDLEMITAAGIGVAVENAVEDIKRVADVIAPPNSEPVIKFILEEIIDK